MTVLDLLRQGKIKPIIAQRLPLEQARTAQELLGQGEVIGKIVLVMGGPLREASAAVPAASSEQAAAAHVPA